MNQKIISKYLLFTFLISYGIWGIIIIVTRFGILRFENPVCMTLFLAGGFGPAVSSYLVQKEIGRISGFKDFLRKAFRIKDSLIAYLLVVYSLFLYFIFPLVKGEMTIGIPIYYSLLLIPVMLLGGGMEESGWRWVLQPELEKRYHFVVATIITSLVWTCWHLPLFFIAGSPQSYVNFWAFLILLIGMSFAQATIYRYSKNIWLCILFHCSLNALPATFVFEENIITNTGISISMILGVLISWQIFSRKYSLLSLTKKGTR